MRHLHGYGNIRAARSRGDCMLIDIFNDRYEHAGTADKKDAHAQGLWHRTFSALVVNPATKTVVLQKKAPGRAGFDRPDYADFTARPARRGAAVDPQASARHADRGVR